MFRNQVGETVFVDGCGTTIERVDDVFVDVDVDDFVSEVHETGRNRGATVAAADNTHLYWLRICGVANQGLVG